MPPLPPPLPPVQLDGAPRRRHQLEYGACAWRKHPNSQLSAAGYQAAFTLAHNLT